MVDCPEHKARFRMFHRRLRTACHSAWSSVCSMLVELQVNLASRMKGALNNFDKSHIDGTCTVTVDEMKK